MANRAYLSLWSKGFSEASMLQQFERLLETVPISAERPGFAELVIRAVDPTEATLAEHDLRGRRATPSDVVELARECRNADSAYEVLTHWDLWLRDAGTSRWQLRPQPLEIICYGEQYDSGVFAEAGHFQADIGFEHLFTGHAGLLAPHGNGATAAPQHPAEAEFLAWVGRAENLREYHQKTRENIQKLLDWLRKIEAAMPVERSQLWSEGEENFEARLDEILVAR